MTTFTESTTIAAPRSEVWATLADIGTIAEWNNGLIGSHRTNDLRGVGATRHCDITSRQNLEEEVVEYEDGELITFRITESTMPFARADIRFTLTDNDDGDGDGDGDGTKVDVTPDYTFKWGPFGKLVDLTVRPMYRKGMRSLLAGLKRAVEAEASSAG